MLKLFVFLALICSSIASASHTHSSRSLSFSSPLIQRQPQSSAHKHIIGRGLLKQRRPVPESWTNAKRLTAGLPLKPPVRRGNAVRSLSPVPSPSALPRPPPLSTPSGSHSETPSSSRSSAPSVTPPTAPVLSTRGSFGCTDAQTGKFVGYISKDLNAFGQYTRTTDSTKRLLLEIDLDAARLGPVDMMVIWRYDSVSGVYPQWVNLDGSKPALHLVYVPNADMFSLTGSVEAFKANFGSVTQCSLSFVPTATSVPTPTSSVY
ncbi:hypothetical protein CCMSSC00406_0006597 [Pleurotus cornucopiae]|uniref:Uncharacterized protein n=1 Tax=Pleurotus cornucopiae TaxID=5321 RepID=A0ACB7IPZ4_PLECO|nr:hypothetical protein CCMSSC00406_0006597 [Pleurotus cornucopiae]